MTNNNKNKSQIFYDEEKFHDDWATNTSLEDIDVIKICEASTSPEIRYIVNSLGNIKNKDILDLGSGLGEVSVYFAIKGAKVTAVDISAQMLSFSKKLAAKYGTDIDTVHTTTEEINKHISKKFDIIYAGNLLHHVDIEETLNTVKKLLKKDGIFISWDPIKYNPIINIYRKIARNVRTDDETPFGIDDVTLIKNKFKNVETKFFWFTALFIFIIMFVLERRDPNQERYWKTVVKEGDKWKHIFNFLTYIDDIVLSAVPPLKWLCWNIVIKAEDPIN